MLNILNMGGTLVKSIEGLFKLSKNLCLQYSFLSEKKKKLKFIRLLSLDVEKNLRTLIKLAYHFPEFDHACKQPELDHYWAKQIELLRPKYLPGVILTKQNGIHAFDLIRGLYFHHLATQLIKNGPQNDELACKLLLYSYNKYHSFLALYEYCLGYLKVVDDYLDKQSVNNRLNLCHIIANKLKEKSTRIDAVIITLVELANDVIKSSNCNLPGWVLATNIYYHLVLYYFSNNQPIKLSYTYEKLLYTLLVSFSLMKSKDANVIASINNVFGEEGVKKANFTGEIQIEKGYSKLLKGCKDYLDSKQYQKIMIAACSQVNEITQWVHQQSNTICNLSL